MEIQGRILKVCAAQSGTSKNGNQWRSQDVIVEYFEHPTDMWSQKVIITLKGHNVDDYHLSEGDEVKVRFGLNYREWEGRYFQEVKLAQDGIQLINRAPGTEEIRDTNAAQLTVDEIKAERVVLGGTGPSFSPTTEVQDGLPF